MSVLGEIIRSVKQYKDLTPHVGVDLSKLRINLTLEQLNSIPVAFIGYSKNGMQVLGGIRVEIAPDYSTTGLWVNGHRIGSIYVGPRTNEDNTHTNR